MNDTLLEALLATALLEDVVAAISAGEMVEGQTLGEAIDWAEIAVDAYNDGEAS